MSIPSRAALVTSGLTGAFPEGRRGCLVGSSSQASLAVTQGMSMYPTRPCPHRSVPEGLLGTEGVLAPALSQDTWRGGRLWHGPHPSGPEPVLPWHRESLGRAMASGLPRPRHDTHTQTAGPLGLCRSQLCGPGHVHLRLSPPPVSCRRSPPAEPGPRDPRGSLGGRDGSRAASARHVEHTQHGAAP